MAIREKQGMRHPARVPVVLQMETLECGAASLAMVMAYYRKWVPLDRVRVACGVSRDGTNAYNIVMAAQAYGMTWKAKRYDVQALQQELDRPAILHWNNNHFVVLCGFTRGKAVLCDPARGRVRVPIAELERSYSNLCIVLKPGEDFKTGGKRQGSLRHMREELRGKGGTVAVVVLAGILAAFAEVLEPQFVRLFTDDVLDWDTGTLYQGLLWLYGAIVAFHLVASLIDQSLNKRATGKVAALANVRFMRHLLRMSLQFFSARLEGDLARRQEENDEVSITMIHRIAPMLMNVLLLGLYVFAMVRISVPLAVMGVVSALMSLVVAQIIAAKRAEIGELQARDRAKMDAATASGIDMIETIKAAGAEDGFFRRWSGFQACVMRSKVRFATFNQYLGTLPMLLQELSNTMVLVTGFWLIMHNAQQGLFSAGMLMAFQLYLNTFLSPVNELIEAGQSVQEMRTSVDRITDVMKYPEDPVLVRQEAPANLQNIHRLSGKLEVRNLTFGYSRLSDPVLHDVSFSLEPGQRVALVGGSGSGKSTVAKLLCGLYEPWEGKILYDDVPLDQIPSALFRDSIAMVDQDVVLFYDTAENNIKMWDKTIDDNAMVYAALDAGIHADIVSRKGGYQWVLQEGGKNLSGGQRQRFEIARALVRNPSLVILDEATSALDAQTEHEVSRSIQGRSTSCVIVAHRLSTVRDCDKILVLDQGRIVQCGTHEELMAQEGLYRSLVSME